ncbi:carbohydrate ABC transporter substrate-binding protein [Paenibacillus nanensis]|uniref:Carbohydrate ABC transporter substrate-binding protein n=1 Tax=Paenibacillus nanensis TaxID=393251 RepID=A0A3A1UV38_9BACL|nr:carbohydrate ABC transporter substrate-binding protein [Paenibacillus nanensis]RIX52409.1 carbohydrate ABC transporter substrate-binding protein [Paenibacillus nanensis]
MKRSWLTVIAVVFVVSSVLAGCSGNNVNNGGNASPEPSGSPETTASADPTGGGKTFENMELEVAVFQGGYGREYWDAVADSFMKDYPGTKINITASPQIAELLRPKIVAGNPPDFIYLPQGGDNQPIIDGFIKDNGLLELNDVFESQGENGTPIADSILPGVLESKAMSPNGDGKVLFAPYNYGVMGMWYNKNLFDTKGITLPKTWDEFFALNSVAKENGRALFTYQGLHPGYLEEIIIPAIFNVGGKEALDQFFNYDPEFWKSETFKKVFGLFEKIANEDNALMNGTVALNHTQSQTDFLMGKSMFIPNGSWFEDEMKDAPREDGFQFGFLGVPSFDAGKPVMALTSVELFMIPAKAKNPELAKEFLKYLYTEKSVKLNGEKAKAVMAVKGAPDLVKEYISATTYEIFKAVDGGMEALNGAFKTPAQGSKFNPGDEVYQPLSSIMNKQMTLEEYGDKLYEVYTNIQKEYQ